MNCSRCEREVDLHATGWAQWVEGWEIKRRSGGANQITEPKRHQVFLCSMCVVRMKTVKQPVEQGTLI